MCTKVDKGQECGKLEGGVLINLMFSYCASWAVFRVFLMFSLWSPSGLWRGISFNGFSCVCMRAWRAVMIDDEMDEDQTRGMES